MHYVTKFFLGANRVYYNRFSCDPILQTLVLDFARVERCNRGSPRTFHYASKVTTHLQDGLEPA